MRHALSSLCVAVAVVACSSHEHAEAPRPLPEVQGVAVLADDNPDPKIVEVRLEATSSTVEIDGKQVAMLGYNGLVPGPMLRARAGDDVIVHFHNALTTATTVHWHGLRIPDAMDGSPRVQAPVEPGADFTYRFKMPEAGSFWYHPHIRANEQVEAGLYAPIVVWDDKDPTYDAERYLMLDDLLLDKTGTKPQAPFTQGHPELMHGRQGDILLTNGRRSSEASSTAEQGTIERWRLVNTSNSRTMQLELAGATFRVIGTDGGRLAEPYTTKRLAIAVGQRFDLEVTYDAAGSVTLTSHVRELDAASKVVEVPYPVFAVAVTSSARVPRAIAWPALVREPRAPEATHTITIDAVEGGPHGVEWRLNGKAHSNDPLFTAAEGTAVQIKLVNKLGPEHPFHLHGQFFEVVGDGKQPGLKDTVLVPGLSTVEILAYMDNPGRWMAHCHILEHAELGMMSEVIVTPKIGTVAPPAGEGHQH